MCIFCRKCAEVLLRDINVRLYLTVGTKLFRQDRIYFNSALAKIPLFPDASRSDEDASRSDEDASRSDERTDFKVLPSGVDLVEETLKNEDALMALPRIANGISLRWT